MAALQNARKRGSVRVGLADLEGVIDVRVAVEVEVDLPAPMDTIF